MTSSATEVRVFFRSVADGEVVQEGVFDGRLVLRDGRGMLSFDGNRVLIDRERVVIFRDYRLELQNGFRHELMMPTPYGTIRFEARTRLLAIHPQGKAVYAIYALSQADAEVTTLEIQMKITEE